MRVVFKASESLHVGAGTIAWFARLAIGSQEAKAFHA
jgi:hypothetical protein